MEVLAWLDERSFEWDMYVDVPAGGRGSLLLSLGGRRDGI